MVVFKCEPFNNLNIDELHNILALRSEVFVVEQNCVYQDLDFKDQKALHIIGVKNNSIVAYTRIFAPGIYFPKASIGRVVVKESERKYGYGYELMNTSIEAVATFYKVTEITISAQEYLARFYSDLGFKQIGDGYLEDGIPHIEMLRS